MRECPVCREKVWPRVGLRSQGWRRNSLDEHVRENHPSYWSWNRKTAYYYLIPLALFLAGSIQAAFLFLNNPAASLVPVVLILFPWLTALLLAASILSVKEKGRQQFRVLWLAEHRYPVT